MQRNSGFTLIEVAIVLVIIGLIVSSIIVGQSLIRSAQLQSVVADASRYEKAIKLFRDKYHALPGDMPNAESFWGSDATCPSTATNTVAKQATCNGDGDGQINPHPGDTAQYEAYRAWQQLANAGFISGSYSGVQGPLSSLDSISGVNTPVTRLPQAVNYLTYDNLPTGDAQIYPVVGHVLNIAAREPATGSPDYPVMSGPEAQMLDAKTDDGLPGKGKIITWKPAWISCADNADPTVAQYIMSDDTIRCALKINMDF